MNENIRNLLIKKGSRFYSFGKLGLILFITGIILICILSILCFGNIIRIAEFKSFGFILAFILTAFGAMILPYYFCGLQLLELGKALQTSEKK